MRRHQLAPARHRAAGGGPNAATDPDIAELRAPHTSVPAYIAAGLRWYSTRRLRTRRSLEASSRALCPRVHGRAPAPPAAITRTVYTPVATDQMATGSQHAPSSRGRLPGSKYTLTETDVLDCVNKASLQRVVAKHAETSRGEAGCCGGKGGVLADWKWIESAPADVEHVLGPRAKDGEPPNTNYYDAEDSALTFLHYNRKVLIEAVYAADSPPFKEDTAGDDTIDYIQPIPDDQLQTMTVEECRAELKKRGYSKPP